MSWRRYLIRRRSAASFTRTSRTVVRAGLRRLSLPSARANPSLPKNHVRWSPMRVNIKEAVHISSHRYGRDTLQRDPAWHVSKLVFGFLPWPLTRVPDMAFVRVYGRATPDRAGARPHQGIPD